MVTKIKILSTPYYVDHDRSFVSKPVAICADGKQKCSSPLLGDLHIAFRASTQTAFQSDLPEEIVIMNDMKVWLFRSWRAPVSNFTIVL